MTRTAIFFAGSALVIAGLLVWIAHTTHPRETAAEVLKPAAPMQERPAPVATLPTADADKPAPESAPQFAAESDSPAVAATVAAPAITGNLYQCLDTAGRMTVQKMPCSSDMQTVKVIPYSVQPGSNTVVEIAQQPQTSNAQPRQASPGEIARARCNDAKQYAQKERQRLGLKVTFDQLRAIEDIVYGACKSG